MYNETKDIQLMRHALLCGVEVAPQADLSELHFLAMASLTMREAAYMARL